MIKIRSTVACLLALLIFTPVLAQDSQALTIAELRKQIAVLEAAERDPATILEIRELNRSFLKQRRDELKSLLEKKVSALRQYLQTVGSSLKPSEREAVELAIQKAEQEVESFTREVQAKSSADLTANLPYAVASTANEPIKTNAPASQPASGVSANPVAAPVTDLGPEPAPPVPQRASSTSFNAELNAIIRSKVRVEQTDNTKQTETPSNGGNTTSLVDQSSASDLIGLAMNFAGLTANSNDKQNDPTSVSVTTSAYALLAAMNRVDPLNPVFYDKHRAWRNFSVTLGYDDEQLPTGTNQRAKIFGAKFLFINRRDPNLDRNKHAIDTLTTSLKLATQQFGDLAIRARGFVFTLEGVRTGVMFPEFKEFLEQKKTKTELDLERARNSLASAADAEKPAIQNHITTLESTATRIDRLLAAPDETKLVVGSNYLPTPAWTREELEYRVLFQNKYLGQDYRNKLGKDAADAVEKFVNDQLDAGELIAFRNLDEAGSNALESIRRAPQLSGAFFTKQRKIGVDEYTAEAIFDYGVANRINLTVNGVYNYKDSKIIGGDQRGFTFGGQLQFQLNRENLLGKKPFYLDVSTNGSWSTGNDAVYRAQGKITIPIADGIDFPISVTYSNQASDLLKEKTVKGQFGFTIDTARLIRAFLFR